ncbi:hypothetical protein [Mesomycoplasma ovipneumoniae]|uniref:hypothetical protein n=1 Tax=Mesomycoplasma ovipneumoniae TaxID=29562 RepID=UPI0024ACE094|nr:hypothetical protein [Mesomycoplasma ovipneumoniae]WHF53185.1 hypothetical protein QJQ40_01905 [Mesomycoplasma ovipneumoniae]
MNKKLKLFKFIVNIITFSLLRLSVFSLLWYFQNTKSYSDFKLTTRDLDLLNSKKPLNFDDLAQIFSTKTKKIRLLLMLILKKHKHI